MADLHKLRDKITSTIYPNGKGAINAADHQALLLDMVDTIGNAIEENAGEVRANGNYPNMSVGFAANLIGRGESIASEIGFRASGGKSIEDGSARITELQGNAVVWNQLYELSVTQHSSNGVSCVKQKNNSIVLSGTLTESFFNLQTFKGNEENHKYLFILSCASSSLNGKSLILLNRSVAGTISNGIANIFYKNTNPEKNTYIGISGFSAGDSINETIFVSQIDLTKMFGSGNEPTTIDEFYNRMPQGINVGAYNEGQLIPSNADGIKSVGDNAWDEKWENGIYNTSNGAKSDNSATIRSKNMTKVLPNTQYYCYVKPLVNEPYAGFMLFYDADKNYIGNAPFGGTAYKLITTPTNAMYMNFYVRQEYGATYSNNINIYLAHSGYKQDVYYSHKEFIKTFDYRIKDAFPDGMMPWDKVYNKNGKGYVVYGTGKVDMGALDWYMETSAGNTFIVPFNLMRGDIDTRVGICSRYAYCSSLYGDTMYHGREDKCFATNGSYVGGKNRIAVRDTSYTDAATFKAAMSGVMLYYELATPTIVEYDEPFNLDYEVWDFGTEEVMSDVPSAPIKAMIRYQFNAVDEVRELRQMIATLQTAIANLQ